MQRRVKFLKPESSAWRSVPANANRDGWEISNPAAADLGKKKASPECDALKEAFRMHVEARKREGKHFYADRTHKRSVWFSVTENIAAAWKYTLELLIFFLGMARRAVPVQMFQKIRMNSNPTTIPNDKIPKQYSSDREVLKHAFCMKVQARKLEAKRYMNSRTEHQGWAGEALDFLLRRH